MISERRLGFEERSAAQYLNILWRRIVPFPPPDNFSLFSPYQINLHIKVMRDSVTIVPLDRYNWESILSLRPKPEQEAFLPSVLYSLAQARFENLHPYGITFQGDMVGYLMYGDFNGICWISRILIDKDYQGASIGSHALGLLLDFLRSKPGCREIRTSFDPANEAARHFFLNLGFELITPTLEYEWVAVWKG